MLVFMKIFAHEKNSRVGNTGSIQTLFSNIACLIVFDVLFRLECQYTSKKKKSGPIATKIEQS